MNFDASIFILGITGALVLACLHSLSRAIFQPNHSNPETTMPETHGSFLIHLPNGQFAPALRLDANADPQVVIDSFGLLTPTPTIFITGGASDMAAEDIERTREIMEQGIAAFAQKHGITVIDGGTEAGVMQMIGEARKKNGYTFPLIGCAPVGRVSFPGWNEDTDDDETAELQVGHSHFVLVNSDEWGGESQMIVNLTRAIASRSRPMIGVLINGGMISTQDVFLATTQGDDRIPILVLDGSGRAADNISTAFKTQRSDNSLIRAIIQGGDIRLTTLEEGVSGVQERLRKHFDIPER